MSTIVSTQHGLLFLLGHSLEDADSAGISLPLSRNRSGEQKSEVINDYPAFITVDAIKQQVTVVVQMLDGQRTFTSTPPYKYTTTSNRDYLPGSAEKKPGIFFTRNQDPKSWHNSDIFIQQFPTYKKEGAELFPPPPGEGVKGRVVVDFWTKSEIIGVFKSNDDNYGAGATGLWT